MAAIKCTELCPECDGEGFIQHDRCKVRCHKCYGTGTIIRTGTDNRDEGD